MQAPTPSEKLAKILKHLRNYALIGKKINAEHCLENSREQQNQFNEQYWLGYRDAIATVINLIDDVKGEQGPII